MFKRIEKKIKKKQEEEELGLDEEMKDVLGLNDTDSDESSDSDSEEDNSSLGGDNDDVDMDSDGEDLDAEENMEGASSEEESGSENGSDDDDDEDDGHPNITIAQALVDPLYVPSKSQPESKSCVVCPHKVLRAPQQPGHLASQAHIGRYARLRERAMDFDVNEGVWTLVAALVAEHKADKESTKATSTKTTALSSSLRPPISISKALKKPFFDLPPKDEKVFQACLLCPRRSLTKEAVDEHKKTRKHKRNVERFATTVNDADKKIDLSSDAWVIVDNLFKSSNETGLDGSVSKRALKRKAKLEAVKLKRQKAKEAKAKAIAKASTRVPGTSTAQITNKAAVPEQKEHGSDPKEKTTKQPKSGTLTQSPEKGNKKRLREDGVEGVEVWDKKSQPEKAANKSSAKSEGVSHKKTKRAKITDHEPMSSEASDQNKKPEKPVPIEAKAAKSKYAKTPELNTAKSSQVPEDDQTKKLKKIRSSLAQESPTAIPKKRGTDITDAKRKGGKSRNSEVVKKSV